MIRKGKQFNPVFVALGLPIGVGIGVAMDNIAIGISVGLAIGAALAAGVGTTPEGKVGDEKKDETQA